MGGDHPEQTVARPAWRTARRRPAGGRTEPGATEPAATEPGATEAGVSEGGTPEAGAPENNAEPGAPENNAEGEDNDGDELGGHVLPDEVEYPEPESTTALPPRIERWRRRSATGAMMTGFALGLREALETEHREPAVVLETSGVPPRDLAVEADLDNLPPRQSVVKIRRWLLHDLPAPTDERGATGADPSEVEAPAPAGALTPAEAGAAATTSRPPTEIRKRERRPSGRGLFGGRGRRA